MKKIFSTLFLFLFVLSFLSPTIGRAIDTTRSGRILDSFKAQQETILFESAPVEVNDANTILRQEYAMNGLEALKNRVQTMQAAYQAKKAEITEVRISLENALTVLAHTITQTEESIQSTSVSIEAKKLKIQQLRSESILLNTRIRQHRAIILSYLTNIYSEGNTIMDDHGKIDIIKGMILTSENTDFSLSDITYKTLVAQM